MYEDKTVFMDGNDHSLLLRLFLFVWRFDSIPGHDVPLWVFAITPIGHSTLGRTPPDK